MKKYALLLIFAAVNLFALEILEKREFSQDLTPNMYAMNIQVSNQGNSSSEDRLRGYFNKLLEDLKEHNHSCTGGGYYLHPRYSNKGKKEGYRGGISFQCKSSKLEDLETSLKVIKKLSKNRSARLSQSQIRRFISEELQKETMEELKFEAIDYVKSYEKTLYEKSKLRCKTEVIDFTTSPSFRPMLRSEKMSLDLEAPITKSQKISVGVTYTFKCR